MRAMMLIVGWILVLVANYAVFLALELYWNFFSWLPRFDWKALGLVIVLLAALATTGWLARASVDRLTRICSLVACVALLSVGAYVLPEEPKTEGLFLRQSPSPVWYRAGRFIAMGCPAVLWSAAILRCRPARTQMPLTK
jgi:hypothetical protein